MSVSEPEQPLTVETGFSELDLEKPASPEIERIHPYADLIRQVQSIMNMYSKNTLTKQKNIQNFAVKYIRERKLKEPGVTLDALFDDMLFIGDYEENLRNIIFEKLENLFKTTEPTFFLLGQHGTDQPIYILSSQDEVGKPLSTITRRLQKIIFGAGGLRPVDRDQNRACQAVLGREIERLFPEYKVVETGNARRVQKIRVPSNEKEEEPNDSE